MINTLIFYIESIVYLNLLDHYAIFIKIKKDY